MQVDTLCLMPSVLHMSQDLYFLCVDGVLDDYCDNLGLNTGFIKHLENKQSVSPWLN